MLLKRAKTRRCFPRKTIGLNNSFTLIKNNFKKIAKFNFNNMFKVMVYTMAYEKNNNQLWPLNAFEHKL